MDIESYYKSVGAEKGNNPLKSLTGPITSNLEETVDVTSETYLNLDIDDHTLDNRRKIAEITEKFHKDSDTLTEGVGESIELLEDKDTLVIETAHQPTLFPYSGTMIKPVVAHVIADALRKKGFSVVELFGILDRDNLKDGWHRRTQLPNMASKDGSLVIRIDTKLREQGFIYAPPPSSQEITKWKDSLVNWVKQNRKAANKVLEEFNIQKIDSKKEKILFGRIREIYELCNDIQPKASSYGSFNSLFLTNVVNRLWDYPTLFIPYSSSIQVFEEEIRSLVEGGRLYVDSHNRHRDTIKEQIKIDFKEFSHDHIPFWYVCECGIKIRLNNMNEVFEGECKNCDKNIRLKIDELDDYVGRLSPHSISRHLIFFEGLKPSVYISGWGAMPFTLASKGISDDIGFYHPPVIPLRINERYRGIGQLRPFYELKRRDISISDICSQIKNLTMKSDKLKQEEEFQDYKNIKKEIRDLEGIRNSLNTYPSILDYWINFGIKETMDIWEEFIRDENFFCEREITCFLDDER
ncbi:MAG: hypothetical protein SVY15_05490 [Halobacteriota archaeon]|nr:hypothetical protein [Halobacteriota archaeon]